MFNLRQLAALAVICYASPSHAASSLKPSKDIAKDRAPQIFNSVHDSMRQWGSSLHHNGVSFFLATVPEGVLLYHGNNRPESPTEPDWLAYEIEHAEQFARSRGPPPGRDKARTERRNPFFNLNPVDTETQQHILNTGDKEPQIPDDDEKKKGGWLHVYKTTRALPFLYIDGMGGGKTEIGTLDSQDYLLRNKTQEEDEPGKPHRGPMGEGTRARELCELSASWGLQGVIRMEAGFEIIKCDFKDGLEEIQTLQRPVRDSDGFGHPPGYGPGGPDGDRPGGDRPGGDRPDRPGKGPDGPDGERPDGPGHWPVHGPDGPGRFPDHGPDGPGGPDRGPNGPEKRPDGSTRRPGKGPRHPEDELDYPPPPRGPWSWPGPPPPPGPPRSKRREDGPEHLSPRPDHWPGFRPRHPEDGLEHPPPPPAHWPWPGPPPPRYPRDGAELPSPEGPQPRPRHPHGRPEDVPENPAEGSTRSWPGPPPRQSKDEPQYPPPHGPGPRPEHPPRRPGDRPEHPPPGHWPWPGPPRRPEDGSEYPPPRGPKPWPGHPPRRPGGESGTSPGKHPGRGPGHGPGNGPGGSISSFEFLRGISNRYDGIGSTRTILDYSSMVSAYFFPVNLTNPDPKRPDLPRLTNLSDDELKHIRGIVGDVVKERLDGKAPIINWQDVADLVVKRYAERLQFMTQKGTSSKRIADEANFLLDTFIDYSTEEKSLDNSASISRCSRLYLQPIKPKTTADGLIYSAFEEVLSQICTTLFKVRDISLVAQQNEDYALPTAVGTLQSLLNYLGWASFKRCPPCGVDEVCLIPMWPFGTVDAYEHPQCVKSTDGRGDGESYWGDRPGPPPPKYE